MTKWVKVPYSGRGRQPPYWLEMRQGKIEVSYRVRYRADGCQIQKTLDGPFSKWEDAFKAGEKLIATARFGERRKIKSFVTCAEICDEIVNLKKTKSKGTYEQAEIFFRVHIKPFLEAECPYITELDESVWMRYKHKYRINNPGKPLFGHWKFFSQLFRMAALKGYIPYTKISFNERKEDNRQIGQVIPDKHLQLFIRFATDVWKDRCVIQRLSGQRPGIIRTLKKSYVDFSTGIVTIPKYASKNRRSYQFQMPDAALKLLKKRLEGDSPYFFPNRSTKSKPMDSHLKAWHQIWEKAGINQNYTPHDLRHTFLTDKVNEPGINLSVLCYSCDLSIKELTRTYLHLSGSDTKVIAEKSNAKAKKIFGDVL